MIELITKWVARSEFYLKYGKGLSVGDAPQCLPVNGEDSVAPLDTAVPVCQTSRDDFVDLWTK